MLSYDEERTRYEGLPSSVLTVQWRNNLPDTCPVHGEAMKRDDPHRREYRCGCSYRRQMPDWEDKMFDFRLRGNQ